MEAKGSFVDNRPQAQERAEAVPPRPPTDTQPQSPTRPNPSQPPVETQPHVPAEAQLREDKLLHLRRTLIAGCKRFEAEILQPLLAFIPSKAIKVQWWSFSAFFIGFLTLSWSFIGWWHLFFILLTISVSGGAAVAVQIFLPKLGLGPRARVEVTVSKSELAIVLCDWALPDEYRKFMDVLYGLTFSEVRAVELTVAIQPWKCALDIRSKKLELIISILHPDNWDQEKALADADVAALAALEMALTSLAVVDTPVPPPGVPPPSFVTQLVDGVIHYTTFNWEDFTLVIENKANNLCWVDSPAAVGLRIKKLVLPQATPVNREDTGANPWAHADPWGPWNFRDIVSDGWSLSVKAAGREFDGGVNSGDYDLVSPFGHSITRLTMPPVMQGLLSGHRGLVRRIDVACVVHEDLVQAQVNQEAGQALFGILNNFLNAGAWTGKLFPPAVAKGRSVETYEERKRIVESICGAKANAENKDPLSKLHEGIRCADALALRWWAEHEEENLEDELGFDPKDDDAWSSGVERFWETGVEASLKVGAQSGVLQELGISVKAPRAEADLGHGAGRLEIGGVGLSVQIQLGCEVVVLVGVTADTEVILHAKPNPDSTLTKIEHCTYVGLDQAAQDKVSSCPIFDFLLTVGKGPMRIDLSSKRSWTVLDLPAWMNTCLFGIVIPFVGSDAVIDAPPVPNAGPLSLAAGSTSTPKADQPETEPSPGPSGAESGTQECPMASLGFLGGLVLQVRAVCENSELMFPDRDHLDPRGQRGIVSQTKSTTIILNTDGDKEDLHISFVEPAVRLVGDEYIVQPLMKLDLLYELSWNEKGSGYLMRLKLEIPFSKLCVSPRIVIIGNRAQEVLFKGVAALGGDKEAAPPPTESEVAAFNAEAVGAHQAELQEKLRTLFEQVDKDASGTLNRGEVWGLLDNVCQHENSLTYAELSTQLEIMWASLAHTGNDEVSFDDFCGTLGAQGYLKDDHQICGALRLAAGDVHYSEVSARIGASADNLYAHIKQVSPKLSEAAREVKESHQMCSLLRCAAAEGNNNFVGALRGLQWRLLRSLQNYDAARHWWNMEIGPAIAPDEAWQISPSDIFRPASEVIRDALSGHFEKATELKAKGADNCGSIARATKLRTGLELALSLDGIEVGFHDALSLLRGEAGHENYRLKIVAGREQRPSQVAVQFDLCYWHNPGEMTVDMDDVLEVNLRLRDFYGSCLDPAATGCQHTDDTQHYFMEKYGFSAEVRSKRGDPKVLLHFVSDQHLVVNVTSSLLLSMQPIMQSLLPAPSEVHIDEEGLMLFSTPLDYTLHMLGEAAKAELNGFGLLNKEANSAGWSDPDEEQWTVTADLLEQRRSPAISLHRPDPAFGFALPLHRSLTRVCAGAGWEISRLELKGGVLRVELHNPNRNQTSPKVTVYTRRRSQVRVAAPHASQGPRSRDSLDATESDVSHRLSPMHRSATGTDVAVSKQLCIMNRCGMRGQFFFEPDAKRVMKDKPVMKDLGDNDMITCDVPRGDSTLCIIFEGLGTKVMPHLNIVGCRAVPLPVKTLPKDKEHSFGSTSSHRGTIHRQTKAIKQYMTYGKPAEVEIGKSSMLCLDLSVSSQGKAFLQIKGSVELRNATRHRLFIELIQPGGHLSNFIDESFALDPGQDFQVPLHALDGHMWMVRTSGAVSHSFLLGGSILQLGSKESAARRALGLALETHTVPGQEVPDSPMSHTSSFGAGGGSASTFRRFTIVLLPGLRVVNALPIPFTCAIERYEHAHQGVPDKEDQGLLTEKRHVTPGAVEDFGMVSSGYKLTFTLENHQSYALEVPAMAMHENRMFRGLSKDITLGSLQCSVQCTWATGVGPEIVVYGQYLVYNKTGLAIKVHASKSSTEQGVPWGQVAIVKASEEHMLQVAIGYTGSSKPTLSMPQHSSPVNLHCWSAYGGEGGGFKWSEGTAVLKQGSLFLEIEDSVKFRFHWRLSEFTTVKPVEVLQAYGEAHAFRLQDPQRGHNLMLKAASSEDLGKWLEHLQTTVEVYRRSASQEEMPEGWGGSESKRCMKCAVPPSACNFWSREIPVLAPDAGEVQIISEAHSKEEGALSIFLGVQVRPLIGALGRSSAVTFTPRYVVQNRTGVYIQVLPALIPPGVKVERGLRGKLRNVKQDFASVFQQKSGVSSWDRPVHESLAIARTKFKKQERSSSSAFRPVSVSSFGALSPKLGPSLAPDLSDELPNVEGSAVWVPPGESVSIYHFPLQCTGQEAPNGRKAVSLRLAGRVPLEVILQSSPSANPSASGNPLPLQQVDRSYMPYSDGVFHFGALPQSLRSLSNAGRLRGLVGRFKAADFWGELILTIDADVFVALPSNAQTPAWLLKGWEKKKDLLDLRDKGPPVQSLTLFHKYVKAGPIDLDTGCPGTVLLFGCSPRLDCREDMGEASGLPWCPWVHLDATGEKLRTLQAADGSEDGHLRFVNCCMQVESSTAFLVVSETKAPYRLENYSPERTLAVLFLEGTAPRILPPLSWWAFNLPENSTGQYKFVVHDVATKMREMCDLSVHGRGKALVLSEEKRKFTGSTAPLEEEGYRAILLMSDIPELFTYAKRVCIHLEPQDKKPPDFDEKLKAFVEHHSQDASSHSLQALRSQLVWQGHSPGPKYYPNSQKLGPTQEGFDRASICDASLGNFISAILIASDLRVEDKQELYSFASVVRDHDNMDKMLSELPGSNWVTAGTLALETVYNSAMNHRNLLTIRICLWRALFEHGIPVKRESKDAVNQVMRNVDAAVKDGVLRPWSHVKLSILTTADARVDLGLRARADTVHATRTARLDTEEDSDGELPMIIEAADANAEGEEACMEEATMAVEPVVQETSDVLAIARSEALSEEGYEKVFQTRSGAALARYVGRVVNDQGGEILDRAGMRAFCVRIKGLPHHSFAALRRELRTQDWYSEASAKGSAKLLNVRWHDGVTKVLSFTEAKDATDQLGNRRLDGKVTGGSSMIAGLKYAQCQLDVQFAGLHICFLYDQKVHALGTGVENMSTKNEEIFTMTFDHFRIHKEFDEEKIEVFLHHFQIDSMRKADTNNPIILAPKDSGYHIYRREKPSQDPHRKYTPVFYVAVETVPSGITHLRNFELLLQPVQIRLDATFWQDVGLLMYDWLPKWSVGGVDDNVTEILVSELCDGGIEVPGTSLDINVVYFENFHVGTIVFEVEFLMQAKERKSNDEGQGDVLEEDAGQVQDWNTSAQSAWLSSLSYRLRGSNGPGSLVRRSLDATQFAAGYAMRSVGQSLVSGVGHIKPKLVFPELAYENECGNRRSFEKRVVDAYWKSGKKQVYKVLLSTNILGDPIGLGASVTDGVYHFFRETRNEIKAGELKGEGVKLLTQGVVGGISGHAGKMFGALGDTVDALAHTGGTASSKDNVEHVGDGLASGLKVFGRSAAAGVSGVVLNPLQGFKEKGILGFGQGVMQGVTGFVAKPVSGALHGIQKVAEGIDATTHLWDHEKQIRTRRTPRKLGPSQPLRALTGLELLPKISLFIDRINMDCLKFCQGGTFIVEMLLNGKRICGSRLGRLTETAIIYEECHWIMNTESFLEHDLIIQVRDKSLKPISYDGSDPTVVFRAKLPKEGQNSAVPGLARMLRCPQDGALTTRLRPADTIKLNLEATGQQTRGQQAQLHLRFWPAWDPESFPFYMRYWPSPVEQQRNAAAASELPDLQTFLQSVPSRAAGLLDKKAIGKFNHWSTKYVVVEASEFKYWQDKKDFDARKDPHMRIRLTSNPKEPNNVFRFARGEEPECFVQTLDNRSGTKNLCKWRPHPTQGSPQNVDEWLRIIYQHYTSEAVKPRRLTIKS